MKTQAAHWQGRPIVDADHVHDLEQRSAIHEFSGKMTRTDAENKAYTDYVRDRRLEAAAHHLLGVKAAQGAGEMDQARKHGAMYELHMKALDLNPHGPVPPEVTAKMNAGERDSLYRFKVHKGDFYALQEQEEKKAEDVAKSELGRELLKKVAEDVPAIEVLYKADPELKKESCDYTAKSTGQRCKNPRSRLVGNRYLCHHHSDPAAKDDHKKKWTAEDYKKECPTCGYSHGEHAPTCMG